MENAAALAAKLGDMKGIKEGLRLAKVAQDYAQQQGVPLPSLNGGKERTMNDTMPGAFGKAQSSEGGFGGLLRTASTVLGGGGNNTGFTDNSFGAGLAGTAATAAGFAGMQHFAQDRGEPQQQQRYGRSNSFGGDGGQQRGGFGRSNSFSGGNNSRNNNNFQQQGGGFGQQGFGPTTPQGFGPNNNFATPGTFGPPTPQSGFGPGAPAGFNNQAYPPAYSVMDPPQFGFSGAMTTNGQPYGVQQAGWGQQQQQQQQQIPPFNNGGFVSQPGFVGGSSGYGQTHQRGNSGGGGWGTAAAGGLAAAGLGAALGSTYNSAFGSGNGGSAGYGFPTGMQQGYHNPAAAYGGPPLPPNPGKQGKKKNKNKDKSAVVTDQPPAVPAAVGGWLHVPAGYELPEGIPKGLEILAMVDGLMVHQEVETLEAIANAIGIGYEGNNQYKISNRSGVHVYQAVEETGFCWRCCCTQLRPVHMKVFDQTGTQVLAFQRHFRLFPCAWFEPCRENVTVFHGKKDDGKVIGRVTQSCCGGCCTPKLNILSRKGDRELIVKGPCVIGDMCGVKFDVLTDSKKTVGEVKKLAPGSLSDILKEVATDADKFTIQFPQDLKVETKATALVALLLVDLLFFEYGGNTNRNLDGTCTIDLCVMFCCGCPVPCRMNINGPDVGTPGKGAPVADEIVR